MKFPLRSPPPLLFMVLCKHVPGIPEIYKQKRFTVLLLHSVITCLFKEAWLHVSPFDVLVIVLKYLLNEWMGAFPICVVGSPLSIIMELK